MSQNNSTSGKASLANDTRAFRRTLLWCGVAAAIHVIIIGGVSAGQWMFASGESDKDKASITAPANVSNAAGNTATANTAANTASAARNHAASTDTNRAGNSAMEKRLDEKLPPPSGGPDTGGVKFDLD